jgi:hypothetical protein
MHGARSHSPTLGIPPTVIVSGRKGRENIKFIEMLNGEIEAQWTSSSARRRIRLQIGFNSMLSRRC